MIYGNITNIKPESTKLVTALITEPKTHIRYFRDKLYKSDLTNSGVEIEVGHSKHKESTFYKHGDY